MFVSVKRIAATVAAFALFGTNPAAASTHLITVDGELNNYSATLFGDASLQIPVNFQFVLNSQDATFIPANTPFDAFNHQFSDGAYSFSKNNVPSLVVTIGNATFTSSDLISQSLGQLGSFDVLVTGELSAPSGLSLGFVNSVLGEFRVGNSDFQGNISPFDCVLTICSLRRSGSAFSYQDGGFGDFNRLSFVSQEISGAVP